MSEPELTKQQIRERELEEVESAANSDVLARTLRILSSTVLPPFLGSLFGEVVSNAIPNQRLDRVVQFLKLLGEQLGEYEEQFVESQFALPGVLDIWSEGAKQAAEAYTEEKILHIATFVGKAVTSTEVDVLKVMSIAKLLEKVNHVEIIILRAFSFSQWEYKEQEEFEANYPDIFAWRPERYIGSETPEGDLERWGFIENW